MNPGVRGGIGVAGIMCIGNNDRLDSGLGPGLGSLSWAGDVGESEGLQT
jgi:hypothetical protein